MIYTPMQTYIGANVKVSVGRVKREHTIKRVFLITYPKDANFYIRYETSDGTILFWFNGSFLISDWRGK